MFVVRNRCRRLQLCNSRPQVTRGANGAVAHLGFQVLLSHFEEEERKKDFSVRKTHVRNLKNADRSGPDSGVGDGLEILLSYPLGRGALEEGRSQGEEVRAVGLWCWAERE